MLKLQQKNEYNFGHLNGSIITTKLQLKLINYILKGSHMANETLVSTLNECT